jgi:hypothetical protein
MLSLKRFKALLDSYGAAPQRWPETQRAPGLELLRNSREAQRCFEEAQRLDQTLQVASTREDATLWPPGEREAALASLRARVWAHRPNSPIPSPRRPARFLVGAWASTPTHWAGAMALGVAVVALGVWIGGLQSEPPPADLLTMLSAPIHALAW